jgi:hypothetical protein
VIEPRDASDALLQAAMFEHLDRLVQTSPDGALASAAINTFTSRGGKQVDRSKMFRRLAAQAKPLALESSNYSNVPPVRIQQAPCSPAPTRMAYNGLGRLGEPAHRTALGL